MMSEAKEAAKAALEEFFQDKERQCRCSLDMETHKRHHEFVDEAIEFMRKVNETKWGVLKAVLIAVLLFLGGTMFLGLKIKIGG